MAECQPRGTQQADATGRASSVGQVSSSGREMTSRHRFRSHLAASIYTSLRVNAVGASPVKQHQSFAASSRVRSTGSGQCHSPRTGDTIVTVGVRKRSPESISDCYGPTDRTASQLFDGSSRRQADTVVRITLHEPGESSRGYECLLSSRCFEIGVERES